MLSVPESPQSLKPRCRWVRRPTRRRVGVLLIGDEFYLVAPVPKLKARRKEPAPGPERPKDFPGILRRLAEEGWARGAPQSVTLQTIAIDGRSAAVMICPGCGRKGLTFHPHQRAGVYRPVALCNFCGHGEEI